MNRTEVVPIKMTTTFAKGNVNAFILPGSPLTLVDTGTHQRESVQQLREGLAEAGYAFSDLEQIVITHMHTDHFGGLSAILEETDAAVFVHQQAKALLTIGVAEAEREEEFVRSFIEECGAAHVLQRKRKHYPLDWGQVNYLDDGDELCAGDRKWQVLYTPGHSQTDICLWDPLTGDVIVGDFLLQEISSNAFVAAPRTAGEKRPRPLMQMRESFRKVYDLPFGTVYPGHGEPFGSFRGLIDRRLQEQRERCQKIVEKIAHEPRTVYEITRALFPWIQENHLFLGLSEVQGHLDLLLDEKRVDAEYRGPIAWYRAAQEKTGGELR